MNEEQIERLRNSWLKRMEELKKDAITNIRDDHTKIAKRKIIYHDAIKTCLLEFNSILKENNE